jgi:hypothetical protein
MAPRTVAGLRGCTRERAEATSANDSWRVTAFVRRQGMADRRRPVTELREAPCAGRASSADAFNHTRARSARLGDGAGAWLVRPGAHPVTAPNARR